MTSELKPHAYQEAAIDFVLENKAVYLALDMGLGKTLIALEVAKRTGQKAFVFGPLRTICSSWPAEIAKWAPGLTFKVLHGDQRSLVNADDFDILLMNYEGLPWLSRQRGKWSRRIVVFDESSKCKSHSTARFKLLRKMRQLWTEYALCLSATPAPNSMHDLWSQYFLLDQGARLGKNITEFRGRYCTSFSYPGMSFTKYNVHPDAGSKITKAIAPITYRLAASDYIDMPAITYNRIICELPAALTKKYKKLEKELFMELESGVDIMADNTALASMKCRQFVQGGVYDEEKIWHRLHTVKLSALKELVETSAGQPILCAIQFKGELKMIREAFPTAPVIAGGTSPEEGTKCIKQWNSGLLPLLLCHPASLSHGLNLQAGGHILLWYGITWSLEQYIQLAGRLYRQGQKHGVFIHHLVMKNTVDEVILDALASKDAVQSDLLTALKKYHSVAD